MKTSLTAIAAIFSLTVAAPAAPRLVISTPSLVPESQIDVVLDSAAAAPDQLGKPAAGDWLKISPELPGTWIWQAPDIMRFTPSAAPAVGASYTFSISPGRVHLDGTAVPAGKFATAAAEPFRILAANPGNRWSPDYSRSTGSWVLAFNDDVDPSAAAAYLSFSSKDGRRVAARIAPATVEGAGYFAGSYKRWAQRLPEAEQPEMTPESLLSNMLVVTPDSPLPVGKNWTLSVLKGLPNQSAGARLSSDSEYAVGDIEPFVATKIEPFVAADVPRQVVINFNQPIPEALPADFLETAIEVTPVPADLAAKVQGRRIILTGDFSAADKFHVRLAPPFSSRAGLSLAGPASQQVEFKHLDPQLILPSDNQAQLANGNRSYRIETVNLDRIHVRIKKLGGTDLIRAYQGYRHYTGSGHDGQSIEPSAPLPYALVAGETIFDREIPLGNAIDTSKEIVLRWDEILPADLRHAAVFLDVTGIPASESGAKGRRNAQALVQLTDIGLAWKLTGDQALIYAFSCDTGAPLPDVTLQLFGEDATTMQSVSTDASGLATLPRPGDARHLRASVGTDSYLTAFDSTLDIVGLWHFPIRYSWTKPPEKSRQAFLFSDRSLYRPGETVRVKGIIRSRRGNDVEMAESAPARLVVLDPADKEIHTSPVNISSAGSFDFTYTLAFTKTGQHEIRLEFPDDLDAAAAAGDDWEKQQALLENGRFTLPIRVEDFRRNAFEIKQEIAAVEPGSAKVAVDLAATYYQGQPVAAGKVGYYGNVTSRNPYPERFRDYLFGNHRTDDWAYWYHYFGYRQDERSSRQTNSIHGEASLSTDGKASISIDLPQTEFPTTREVTVSSQVTDANNQTLTANSSATVHPAAVYVGVSRVDRLVRAGEDLPLKIVAAGTDGEPFPAAVQVTATLTREVNSAVKSRTDSGATTTRNDRSEETVMTSEMTIDPAASAGQGTILNVTPAATGLHFLTLRGTDPEGREFATVTRFHVYGTDDYPWLYEDGLRVKLVAEKKSYKPGETARVLVLTPIEGTALVTVEREKVLRSFLVTLKADQPVIEVPLSDEDAPNAFVSVLIVKGAKESAREHKEPQLRLGYCELTVENQRDRLDVVISDPPDSTRPGDDVLLTGTVTLADGSPAAGAEVTLYAEDEGTLAVMGYETPAPMDHFYKPRVLEVDSGTSFQTFISENPDEQYFHNKGFFIGGGGDMEILTDFLRKNFDPCATWAPALVAGADGKFSHSFKVPDTLTRYRVVAVAHHGAARFGHAESALVVKKDLMLEPKAPRFAHQSDTFDAQVLVQNASAHSGTWQINYNASNGPETPAAVALGPVSQTVTLAPGGSATVVFPTRAETLGEAVLTWSATPLSLDSGELTPVLARALSDAVETRFNVLYPMPLLRQSKFVKLEKGATRRDLLDLLDRNLVEGEGDIDLEFARSPLVEAAGAVDFLLTYPYGCVEQTTSSLIPWLAVNDLRSVIPRFAETPETKVAAAIQAGADRLLSMQLPDGSFSYWPGSTERVPWASAYAGMGLVLAAEKGAAVPPSAISSLVDHLSESLRGIADERSAHGLESHARALLVLAMAGSPQPAYRNKLVDRIEALTPAARALLAASTALEDKGNEANLAIARSLLGSSTPFKLDNDGWMPWTPGHAYHLIAWLAVDPAGPEADVALDRMFRDRNPYGHWRTTWVNGWSLVAMAAYAKEKGITDKPASLTLETPSGNSVLVLDKDQPVAARSFKLSPGLKLNAASDERVFVRVSIAAKPRIQPIQPVATNGLAIDRFYHRILPDGTEEILTEPRVGDLIRVSLRVTLPRDGTSYVVVEDPLASLFETVNSDFQSQRSAAGVSGSENDWSVSHSELRSDRAVFFLDHVRRGGTHTLSYLARCTIAGRATAPPAKVESMYDPEKFALSASRIFAAN